MAKWIKIVLVIMIFALISVALFFIFKALNLTDLNKIKEIILNSQKWAIVTYILITVLILSFLCFVPLINTALVVLGIVIFGAKITFISCVVSNAISSSLLFFVGDKFGEKLATKLVGKEDLEKAQNLIDTKSKILLPILFTIPGIPDEALCLVAGMTKMKYWYLLLISTIFHSIELAIICFLGSGIINWSAITITDWIIIFNIIIIDIYLISKLEKYLENKNMK